MIGFVILHYVLEDVTKDCVRSIESHVYGDIKIVVVDNASPNGSGERLCDHYANDDDVIVILNEENLGFSRGNNTGYTWLRENADCDFVVILNNDTEIPQTNFHQLLEEAYEKTSFDILGPDVLSMKDGAHQSPQWGFEPDRGRMKRVIAQHGRRLKYPFLVTMRHTILSPAIKLGHHLKVKKNRKSFDNNRIVYGVPLHGSCLIFSRQYVARHRCAFYPHNFMHSETEILQYFKHVEGLKTVFYPAIQIYHFEDMSTEATYKGAIRKDLFFSKCLVDSSKVVLGLLDGDARENVSVMVDEGTAE